MAAPTFPFIMIRRLGCINAILLGGVAFGVVHLWLSWACCHRCKSQSPGAQCCCPVIRLRFVCALVRLTDSIAPDHYKHVGPRRHLDSRHREEGLGNPRVWTDRSSWDRGVMPTSTTGTGRRPGHHNSAGGTPCRGSLRKRRRTRTRECDRQQPGGVAVRCARGRAAGYWG